VPTNYRRPVSVLIVVHSDDAQVLLLRRAQPFDFWQSITGSLDEGESHADAARRELFEETGLRHEGVLEYTGMSRQFVIDPRWRKRFGPGIVENVEFEWRYRVPQPVDIRIDGTEHTEYRWLPLAEAIDVVWSWTNRVALRSLEIR
jgi:dATP pyrophosphohydrolase